MTDTQKKISSILIVDDSEGDQLLSKITIGAFDGGIEILQAYDGQEALEILSSLENEPDYIFLDVNMPGMNGHEFLEKYSKELKTPLPVVIMLTSSNQDADKEKALSYPFVKKYALKPINESFLAKL